MAAQAVNKGKVVGTLLAVVILVGAAGAMMTTKGCEDAQDATAKGPAPAPGDKGKSEPKKPDTLDVKIAGRTFKLELAIDDEHRFKGLSGRTEVAKDGGLMFVFPRADQRSFVMRDCVIDIDIIYLDGAGRVVSFYKMTHEGQERLEDEKVNSAPTDPRTGKPYEGYPEWAKTNEKYENRLKKYPSKFATQFVVELKGGTLDELKLKEGDKVEFDVVALKRRAK